MTELLIFIVHIAAKYYNLFQTVSYCEEIKSCVAREQQVAREMLCVYLCNVKPAYWPTGFCRLEHNKLT